MIREKKMEGFAQFIGGDAFDRASLATVTPRPTLGVVSGLYELFPENAMVRESLAGLADAIEPEVIWSIRVSRGIRNWR
jgi:hypothetical protein